MKKIGFVIPWYGDRIPGGAEMEARTVVKHLIKAGVEAEVLTTCVKEFTADWNVNYYQEGLTDEAGVPVRRFLVRERDTDRFNKVNLKLMNNIRLTAAEEETFMREMVNSPDLYDYIENNKKKYDLFVFIPYMFGTTYYGSLRCLDRAVMLPCFHEEAYIHMKILKNAFEHAAGIIYNAEPEKELTNKVFYLGNMPQIVMGLGMDTSITYDADRFRKKYQIEDPFLLYAGRKDVGKNIYLLLNYFTAYRKVYPDSRLKLVLIGGGEVTIPEESREAVLDLGFVDIQDKYDANAAALALCQPSVHESFSIVIMESWLCGRPVLVHEDCAVTKNFAIQSNGGLYFHNFPEFVECVDYLLEHEDTCREMGRLGGEYVRQNFEWDVIVDKYLNFFDEVIRRRENMNESEK